MNNNEYTIACLIDKLSVTLLRRKIPFLDKSNYPHISFFQFKTTDKKLLSYLENFIQELSISNMFLTNGIKLVEDNIFLDIHDDSTLQTASDKLAELYFTHCKHKMPLSQINFMQLEETQLNLVKKYGIYWIKENFRPHVTLAYENYINLDLNLNAPESINIISPGIYPIDKIGRILSAPSFV